MAAGLPFISYAADYTKDGVFADWLLPVIPSREAKFVLSGYLLQGFEKLCNLL
ncbi:hypothetical protein LTSEHVI_3303 [Salmonella enterica subsp. enterica serovar Hvittingfoss str. A4-620]|nr:hypothetical protein LTSEHVI_3303 [Salmonella enterica subsp. enterica serovar Hvittingfoss str. A4-620]